MKVLIIGSGLVGVTSAYFLARRGYEVTVIDRAEGPGRETSFANGALLTPSMSKPWNAPGCWRTLLASIGRSDSALQLRLKALPAMLGWGARLLRNSSAPLFERHTLGNLRLALYSLEVMETLREEAHLEYGRVAGGTLSLFRDRTALDRACKAANQMMEAGLNLRELSRKDAVQLEPTLEPIADQLAGAIHYVGDEVGDAYRFCVDLADRARGCGVHFRFSTEVSTFEVRGGRVIAALRGAEGLVADRYVVAAGSYSMPLLKKIGIHVPVQPIKGYSITFMGYRGALRIPLVDDGLHVAAVPLEGALRAVGTAQFAGFNTRMDPGRIDNLLKLLSEILPRERLDPQAGRPWCGLRPMSADGVPIIGYSPLTNLLINTGHGQLGWTMAAGSACLLTALLSEETPEIDPKPYDPARFISRF